MFWVLKNAVVWAVVWELALSWWIVIRLRRLIFLISCEKTGKQMVVYHSELNVMHYSSGTIAPRPVFPKKTGDYLLGSAMCASNFCCIWLILKYPYSRLLFTFGLMLVNPWFITCHDIMDVFRSTAIVFLEHFFRPIDPFFERVINCVGSKRNQIFFIVKCLRNIEYRLVPLMPKVVSI